MSKIIGIDLGTTFSAIAELDDLGNPEVLSDPENNNRIIGLGEHTPGFLSQSFNDRLAS